MLPVRRERLIQYSTLTFLHSYILTLFPLVARTSVSKRPNWQVDAVCLSAGLRPVIQHHPKRRHRSGLQGRHYCALNVGTFVQFSEIDDGAIFRWLALRLFKLEQPRWLQGALTVGKRRLLDYFDRRDHMFT